MTAILSDVPSALAFLTVGDPTLGGWLVTLGYLVAAAFGWQARRAAVVGARAAQAPRRVERRARSRDGAYKAAKLFWTVLFLALVGLGLNKQLDLHTRLTDLGRELARWQGWYQDRRVVQAVIVGSFGLGCVVGLSILLWKTRCILRREAVAVVGLVLLLAYLLSRAASFHHLDGVFGIRLLGIKSKFFIEFGGILLVTGCAWMNTRWLRMMQRRAASGLPEPGERRRGSAADRRTPSPSSEEAASAGSADPGGAEGTVAANEVDETASYRNAS